MRHALAISMEFERFGAEGPKKGLGLGDKSVNCATDGLWSGPSPSLMS